MNVVNLITNNGVAPGLLDSYYNSGERIDSVYNQKLDESVVLLNRTSKTWIDFNIKMAATDNQVVADSFKSSIINLENKIKHIINDINFAQYIVNCNDNGQKSLYIQFLVNHADLGYKFTKTIITIAGVTLITLAIIGLGIHDASLVTNGFHDQFLQRFTFIPIILNKIYRMKTIKKETTENSNKFSTNDSNIVLRWQDLLDLTNKYKSLVNFNRDENKNNLDSPDINRISFYN